MKRVEVKEATASLGEYAADARQEPVLVLDKGRPIAALLPMDQADWESIALSMNPEFQAIIEESRASYAAEGGYSTDEVRRILGLPANE